VAVSLPGRDGAGGDEAGLGLLTGDAGGGIAAAVLPFARLGGSLAAGDFDGDGRLDLAAADPAPAGTEPPEGPTVGLLLGDGGGGFALAGRWPAGGGPASDLAAADLDGDGLLDLAWTGADLVPGFPGATVRIAWGDGRGGARATAELAGVAEFPRALAAADLDGDGRADLLASGKHHGLLGLDFPARYSVLMNRPLGPCAPGPTTLCLGGGRFRAEAVWHDGRGGTRAARAAPVAAATGSFWFFAPDNLELVVALRPAEAGTAALDLAVLGLTDVAFTLTVTDTATGARRRLHHPGGRLAAETVPEAFPVAPGAGPVAAPAPPEPADAAGCGGGEGALCLAGGRFRAVVAWAAGAGLVLGQATPWSPAAGLFGPPGSDEPAVAVKLLDARAAGGRFWLFFAGLGDAGWTLTVTDTATGAARSWTHPGGPPVSHGDTAAF
jgi:hypothetical protein